MSLQTYSITEEPVGSTYTQLLAAGARACRTALLVVRPSLGLDPHGRGLLEKLDSCNRVERPAREWPGTRLLKGEAMTSTFDLCDESLVVLGTVGGLYSWRQPACPEDLCLLRADGTPWLGSVTHEHDAFMQLSEQELLEVRQILPELRLVPDDG